MKKLAVCLHFYYKNQLAEIVKYLSNLVDVDYDLYVTMLQRDDDIENAIKTVCPAAKFLVVKNQGYDIGPFVEFLHKINIDDYEYVLKLHTKGKKSKNYTWLNGKRMDNALWGKILWGSLLGTKEILRQNLKILDDNKKFGMLGAKYCLTSDKKDYQKFLPRINEELQKMGRENVGQFSFVAGSMFLARAERLKPLLCYGIDDFDETDAKVKEGTFAHILERIFGVLGEEIAMVEYGKYRLGFCWVSIKRFFYQQKVTNDGRKVVKICKLPFYIKEE